MGGLSLLLPFPFPSPSGRLRSPPGAYLSNSTLVRISLSKNPQNPPVSTWSPSRSLIARGLPNDSNESLFLDENGAVEDMDGYLNYLSLEYDSVWDTKPSWCQPWTIILTGVSAISGSWVVLHSLIVTGMVLSLVCTWWYIFLYAYPKEYSNMIAERRKMVTSGFEDTFGRQKS